MPPNMSDSCHVSLVLRLPGEMHLCRSSSNVPRLPTFLKLVQKFHVLLTFGKVHTCHTKRRFNIKKWSVHVVFLTLLLPNVLRATTRCTVFQHLNFKSAPSMVCFVHCHFEMCFAPQRPASPKRAPKLRCFLHFDLEMCFAPQRRATFHLSSGQMAPHPPLKRAYFLTLRSHKSSEKHSASRRCYLVAHLLL